MISAIFSIFLGYLSLSPLIASPAMAGQGVPGTANTALRNASSATAGQDPPNTGKTRCPIDISTMTAQERLDFGNTIPITSSSIATHMGWPASGGVWVLHPTQAQVEELKGFTTTDTEEYCQALARVGATFYSDPNQCEEARIVMEDMRNYEAHLKAQNEGQSQQPSA
ncbi:hypothetical protein BJX63DRAFT_415011 [Aspergillus granulosus]|uniref:Uncharacterized protein n=1 Tax=Aspergillus granulosus TaxID=176169 RepID=A0ABR4GTX8_9EURO